MKDYGRKEKVYYLSAFNNTLSSYLFEQGVS